MWARATIQEPNLSSPEATIRSFVASLNKPDLNLAAKHVLQIKPSAVLKEWEDFLRDAKLVIEVLGITTAESPDGTIATCRLRVEPGTGQAKTETSAVALRRVGESWLIVQPDAVDLESKESFLKLMAAMLSAPKSELVVAQRHQFRSLCMRRLKEVVVATYMFMLNNDDVFKLNGKNLAKKLKPYLKDAKLLACPSHTGKEPSFAFNEALAGKSAVQIDEPEKTVMLYEGSGGKIDFDRHGGIANVGFCDTSVRAIRKGEEKTLRWKP
ncbi:MAG: hypothetical protein HONBIEJF_00543 [Fimbriimonadaceae bacterium]|nr:hypothetical protein [Fimbriimonadaceae bacterium]